MQRQQHFPEIRISDVRRAKCIVLDMTVLLQFLQNAFLVHSHQILGRILTGEFEPFMNRDTHEMIREELILDLPLNLPDILLRNQRLAEQINMQAVLPFGGGHPLHLRLLHLIMQTAV